ncbi:hypothetical protein CRG98_045376, partial [Punica granatum]
DFASPDYESGYCCSDSATTLRLSGLRVPGLFVRLLLSGLRVHFSAFRTSRPRTDFASPDCASGYCFPDSASTLVLSGLRVPGLCVRLLLSGLRVHFSAFRTSRPRTLRHVTSFQTLRPLYCFRTLRPVTAFRTPHPLNCFKELASPDFAS